MCRYIQEIETFLTLQYAIKRGDIGVLQSLLDLLIIFTGAG